MKDKTVEDEFLELGGADPACMSTSEDLAVVAGKREPSPVATRTTEQPFQLHVKCLPCIHTPEYASSGSPLLFRIKVDSPMVFVSFPSDCSYLFECDVT